MSTFKEISIRYLYATLGLFFVALGIALSILSDWGTAPLSCPAYVLNLRFPGISIGAFTFIFNLLYIVVQLILFRDKFEPKYLLQIVASAILGYLIDISMWMCSWIVPDSLFLKILLSVVACFFTALGISMELAAGAWMLSAELTNVAIIYACPKLSFGTAKILMDSTLVLLSSLALYVFFGYILGDGVHHVISFGTLLLAFLPGLLIPYTDIIVPQINYGKDTHSR